MIVVLGLLLGILLAYLSLAVRNTYLAWYIRRQILKNPENTARYLENYYKDWEKKTVSWVLIPLLVMIAFVFITRFGLGRILIPGILSCVVVLALIIYNESFRDKSRIKTFSFLPKLFKKVGIPFEIVPFFKKFYIEAKPLRGMMVSSMMLLPESEFYDLLKQGVRDIDPNTRLVSLDILVKHFPDKAATFLPDFLRDTNPIIKSEALQHILLLKDKQLSSRLVKETQEDSNPMLKAAVQQAKDKLSGSEAFNVLKDKILQENVDIQSWQEIEKLFLSNDWETLQLFSLLFSEKNKPLIKIYFVSALKKHPSEDAAFALVDFATELKIPESVESLIEFANTSPKRYEYIVQKLAKIPFSTYQPLLNTILLDKEAAHFYRKTTLLNIISLHYPLETNEDVKLYISKMFLAYLSDSIEEIKNITFAFFRDCGDETHVSALLSVIKKTKNDSDLDRLFKILAKKMKIHQTDEMFSTLKKRIQDLSETEKDFKHQVIATFMGVKDNNPVQHSEPNTVFCTHCFTRGKKKNVFENYYYVVCRKCNQSQNLISYPKPILGLISQEGKTTISVENIQIQLWDNHNKKAITADIDEIEIGYFEKDTDLEWAASAVITAIQNDITIPQQFSIKCQPNVQLTENLKRMLEK